MAVADEKVSKSGDTMTGFLSLNAAPTTNLHAATKKYVDDGLATKKNTGFDTKIQNSTGFTAISCDSDRYISIKSMNNKLCDILEDEVNQGFTLNTYNKRLNFVSN